MAETLSVVEHVVFFKVKQDVPEQKKVEMVRQLNALKDLKGVLHLSAGPALSASASSQKGFTHVLHSRYADKAGLAAYAEHPSHVNVVNNFVKPIVEDILALDWEAELKAPLLDDFAAKRVAAYKLKTDQHIPGLVETILEDGRSSAGYNFSPARAQGFNFGCLTFFPTLSDLQDQLRNTSVLQSNPMVENVIVMDYQKQELPSSKQAVEA